MLVEPTAEEAANFVPDFTILNAGCFPANRCARPRKFGARCWRNFRTAGGGRLTNPRARLSLYRCFRYTEGMTSSCSVDIHFGRGEMVILGTQYAGEMKKGVLTLMMYATNAPHPSIRLIGAAAARRARPRLTGPPSTLYRYKMPLAGQLPLHSSANEGPDGSLTLFFGLSGTGKTTLSADPRRSLIGDDEHVWTKTGVFNVEGGCYAKCAYLSAEKEPEIFGAVGFGAVVENVVMDDGAQHDPSEPARLRLHRRHLARPPPPLTAYRPTNCTGSRLVDFDDLTVTENTRCAYPLQAIPNAKLPAIGSHPTNVVLLTCDGFGVLPPVSKLTPEQARALACPPPARLACRRAPPPAAPPPSPPPHPLPPRALSPPQVIYHFISGFTSKMAGTEEGVTKPVAAFSSCYGEPFLVWHPAKYATMLAEKLTEHSATAWLLNTGWLGGAGGQRCPLKYSRAIVDAIHSGELAKAPTKVDAHFGLHYPTECAGVPPELLDPASSWADKEGFAATSRELAALFHKNFAEKKYADAVEPAVVAAGPVGAHAYPIGKGE